MPAKVSPTVSRHAMGWNPSRPDQRDHLYAAPADILTALPTSVDLRPQCPPVYDQLALGACTSNAIAGALEFDQIKQKLPEATPSRLFIYYNERAMEHTIYSDAGANIRDGIKSVNKLGACAETLWPYDISQFATRPSDVSYHDALNHRTVAYQRVSRNLAQMKACLASGNVFIIGFTVYTSFESPQVAQTGMMPMPAPGESVLGGHAVLVCGYQDSDQTFTTRNSWSASWGDAGYFYMPYQYLMRSDLSSDFWTIRTIQ